MGWIFILLFKAYEIDFQKCTWNYIKGFFVVFLPVFGTSVALDSYFYGEFTLVPYNFIKVNVLDGLSQSFGADPMFKYFLVELPARLNIFFPCFVLGIIHHLKVCQSKKETPYLMFFMFSYLIFLSLISHKEPKFLLPIFPICFLVIAQYITDKCQKKCKGVL